MWLKYLKLEKNYVFYYFFYKFYATFFHVMPQIQIVLIGEFEIEV
jgi:hypothetical protein